MKLMAIGDQRMLTELAAFLDRNSIELVGFAEVSAALAALKPAQFDAVVVDSSLAEAATVCRCVNDLEDTPLVVMIRGAKVDWAKLQSLNADGYILPGTGRSELVARLRAVLRRDGWHGTGQKETAPPFSKRAGA